MKQTKYIKNKKKKKKQKKLVKHWSFGKVGSV